MIRHFAIAKSGQGQEVYSLALPLQFSRQPAITSLLNHPDGA
jgi:hypothetical protein